MMIVTMILLVSVILPIPAYAQFSIEAFGGKEANSKASLDLFQPTFNTELRFADVQWDDESFSPPPYYGYGVSHFFKLGVGIRAQFTHQKVIANTEESYQTSGVLDGQTISQNLQMSEVVQNLEVTHGLNTIMVAIMGKKGLKETSKFPQGRLNIYGGFGLGLVLSHADSTIRGETFPSKYQWEDEPAVEFFGGARFSINHRLYWLTEYKFTLLKVNAPVSDGQINVRLPSHHFKFGLGVTF